MARLLYPLMVVGRYFVLILQGGALIEHKEGALAGGGGRSESLGPRLIRTALLALVAAGGARLWLHAAFPLTGAYLVSVSAWRVSALALWIAFFLRARYAQSVDARIRAAQLVCRPGLHFRMAVAGKRVRHDRRSTRGRLPEAGGSAARPRDRSLPGQLFQEGSRAHPAAVPLVILVFAFFPGLHPRPVLWRHRRLDARGR